jgi:hypothetical protein
MDSYRMNIKGKITMPNSLSRLSNHISQASRSPQAQAFRRRIASAFTQHPAQTEETYLQHLWFTVRIASRFVMLSVILLTHGLLPFLFTHTASGHIEAIYGIMRKRIPKDQGESTENLYYI